MRWDDLAEGAQVLAVFAYNVAQLPEMLPRKPAKRVTSKQFAECSSAITPQQVVKLAAIDESCGAESEPRESDG